MNSNTNNSLNKVCYEIPKAELHVHIEGTFEPELINKIAIRNNLDVPFNTKTHIFKDLEEFLDIYYKSCNVLLKEEDFSDLVYEYLLKAHKDNVKYAEIFFDPQTHLSRGVSFDTIIKGLNSGLTKGREAFNNEIDGNFIMCFIRDLSEEEAFTTLELALPYKEHIIGVGLDSNEIGHPPDKFKNVFKAAKEYGFRLCAHVYEKGTLDNLYKAIDVCQVDRIDHGLEVIEDKELTKRCAEIQIPFTLCPLSTYKLQRTPDISEYKLRNMLEEGLLVTVNSDDPAYFGGYIGNNYEEFLKVFDLSLNELVKLAKNSFQASFLPEDRKKIYISEIDNYIKLI